ncbi:MAG: HDOD domain-containing protein [Deltaproteobacteria bacterium]|nr:HDOD domain-containing protein [Deltaproteobacteria bacterium]
MATTDPIPSKPLGKVRAYILRIAGLSTTAQKALRICNEPNTCANDLNRVISLDPVLTGRVLQLINSAYYSLPSKVNSLTRAIILLGLNTVKNLVLSFALFESFSKRDTFRVFSADDFWTHSLSVAAAAKLLSIQSGVPPAEREDFFVAGLMHDIGKIPLNHLFPDEYRQAVELALGSGRATRFGEVAMIGVDHCEVGNLIARKWQLSPALVASLGCHHDLPGEAEAGMRMVGVVGLADVLAHGMGAGVPGGSSLDENERQRALAAWNLTAEALATLTAAVAVEIEKARVFLEIARR